MSQSCYSLSQAAGQISLLLSRQDLEKVLVEKKESPQRIALLEKVPSILRFAQTHAALRPGKSYSTYVSLKSKSVTYVVQAAEKRALSKKTWWFPFIGSQPYLGFFKEADAQKKFEELRSEGFDVNLGGVSAFSLLGYFPDPIYSSMLEDTDLAEFAETLFHESLHLTIYIPNFSAFNENLADFVAKRATEKYLALSENKMDMLAEYKSKFQNQLDSQAIFQKFLRSALEKVQGFYEAESRKQTLSSDEDFLTRRQILFDELSDRYGSEVRSKVMGTGYQYAFKKGRINNAVLMGYSLYEAKQAPFEELYNRVGQQISDFVKAIEECFDKTSPKDESELWQIVEQCKLT